MRRRSIAVLAALVLCLAAAPAAFAAEGAPERAPSSRDAPEGGAAQLQTLVQKIGAPLGGLKDPAEETSAGGTVSFAQEVPGTAELRVTVPETLPKAGEQFTVTVDIVGNPGFASVEFTVPYDKDAMECTSANPGDLMKGMMAASNQKAPGGAIVVGASVVTIEGDGRLGVFTFIAKENLTSSDFQLEDVLLTTENNEDIPYIVNQLVTKAPAPPEEQRDLEKEAEEIGEEIENNPDWRPSRSDPETPPAEQQPQTPERPSFTDISGHWAEADVLRAAELGLIGGYADGTFKPDNSLTRAQFVTILYRQAGRPAVTAAAPFTDIANVNDEFRTAIAWAYERRLVDGTSPTTFNPNGPLSRQATMKILFQHGGAAAGPELMFYGVYDGTFPDSGRLAEWARAPMYWGVYNTLIEAGEGNNLNPAQPMTRGQLARSMVRYTEKFGEERTR